MEARAAGARQRREGVSSGVGCRGAECDFADFSRVCPRDLGAFGDGAPPQTHIHLNLEDIPSGSSPSKFGVENVTVLSYLGSPIGSMTPRAELLRPAPQARDFR